MANGLLGKVISSLKQLRDSLQLSPDGIAQMSEDIERIHKTNFIKDSFDQILSEARRNDQVPTVQKTPQRGRDGQIKSWR